MIEKIDIKSFGCYSDFKWNLRDKGNNQVKFKKLNIIYGRNYSGKTTLSRIFRFFETGQISKRIQSPDFEVVFEGGKYSPISQLPQDLLVRVYNKDYVDENLSFLRNEYGHINSFAVLGFENNAIEAKISEIEAELGDADEKTGLRFEYRQLQNALQESTNNFDAANAALEKKLFDKANDPKIGIKHNKLYGNATYDTRRLRLDISKVIEQNVEPLDPGFLIEQSNLLADSLMSKVSINFAFQLNIEYYTNKATELLSKNIRPTVPILELLESSDLQAWVKQGIPLHRHSRESCGFCGGGLSDAVWERLSNHFSLQAVSLEKSIDVLIADIDEENERLTNMILPSAESFYSEMRARFSQLSIDFLALKKDYLQCLNRLIEKLKTKKKNIFSIDTQVGENYDPDIFRASHAALLSVVLENNEYSKLLQIRQEEARLKLRLGDVAKFMVEIGYVVEKNKIALLSQQVAGARIAFSESKSKGFAKRKQVDELKLQLHDERRGAEQVNRYLTHLLGSSLKLDAVSIDDGKTYRFQVNRNESPAFNLSEGECSLIAFCYFLAKLKDISTHGKMPIIYIDDPISSLDSNHIFFVFSLIESELARLDGENRNVRYKQLFISTHNLEFLKYLKRLSREKNNHESFALTSFRSSSVIELMPSYLRNYITELNFLFDEIHTCSKAENAALSHHSFYNFGNNLRKFLEAFLFFKYPVHEGNDDNGKRISMFFCDDDNARYFIERLANEYSHIGEFIDRGAQPIDCDEIARLARFVLSKIKSSDEIQYNCFLRSIGKTDPLEACP